MLPETGSASWERSVFAPRPLSWPDQDPGGTAIHDCPRPCPNATSPKLELNW